MLRTIIIFLLFFLIIRYIVRRHLREFPGTYKIDAEKRKIPPLKDKVVPCPVCGTYNPSQEALQKDEKFFCNDDCYKQYSS